MNKFSNKTSLLILAALIVFFLMQHKAKAELLNFSLPRIEMFRTDSEKMAFITNASFIGSYTAMRMMSHSSRDTEEEEKKEKEKQTEKT